MDRCWIDSAVPRFAEAERAELAGGAVRRRTADDVCRSAAIECRRATPAAHHRPADRRQPHRAAKYAGHRAAASPRRHAVPGGYRRAGLPHRSHARTAAPGRCAAQPQGYRARHLPGRGGGGRQQPGSRSAGTFRADPGDPRTVRESRRVMAPISVRCSCTRAPNCAADRRRSSSCTRRFLRADECADPSAWCALLRAARGTPDGWPAARS